MAAVAAGAFAQRGGFFGGGRFDQFRTTPNVPYDGRFAFVRVKYQTAPGGYWWRGQPAWSHGYPLAEQNLMNIMNELSFLNAHEEINTLALDDPELFKYPLDLHHRSELVDPDRRRSRGAAPLSAEGRLRHRRRLQAAGRLRQPGLGAVRSGT